MAIVSFGASSLCLESRSPVLADSMSATPVAIAETPGPPVSPSPVLAVALTPESDIASPIASTATPLPTATPAQETPAATAVPPADPILVSAVTDDHATKPGATTIYRFRIANASSAPMAVKLVATNSAPGWSAAIFDASRRAQILGPISVPAHGFVEVIVRVTAPRAARVGEQNSTMLAATLNS